MITIDIDKIIWIEAALHTPHILESTSLVLAPLATKTNKNNSCATKNQKHTNRGTHTKRKALLAQSLPLRMRMFRTFHFCLQMAWRLIIT